MTVQSAHTPRVCTFCYFGGGEEMLRKTGVGFLLSIEKIGGTGRTRTADKGFADLCLTTWRRCLKCEFKTEERESGAGEGVRTLDFNLGKVALYH